MGSTIFPAASGGGGVKSIQRGTAASAGNITISAVDTTKTFVRSFSNGSGGTARINNTLTVNPTGGGGGGAGGYSYVQGSSWPSAYTGTLGGGTTAITAETYGVYLSNATTLVATGACLWEVVEFS